MKQLLHVQLGALLLASTITSSLSTSPSNGFLDTCESKFLSSDTVSRNDYTTGIFSFVMYDLVVNKGLNNDVYDDTVLRNKLLRDDGSPRNGYSNYLPPYEALPEAVMDVFTDFSCQLYDGSGNIKIGKFCKKYLNGKANATDTPETAFIAVSKLKKKEAMAVANKTCNTVSNNWNDLINNAIHFYLDEGLLNSTSTASSLSPNPVLTNTSVASSSATADAVTTSSTTGNAESSQPTDSATDRPASISSVEGRTSQAQQAVGGNQAVIGLGAALGGLALAAALAGFFVFRRKSNGAKDKEIISPDDDVDGNLHF